MSKAESLVQTTLSYPQGIQGSTKSDPTVDITIKKNSTVEKNFTDPKVCHDPSIKFEGIARLHTSQNKVNMENADGDLSTNNEYDALRIDGIEYPLVAINNRNVENHDILSMTITYKDFLPHIYIQIHDIHQSEQKISSTQMSSIIRVVMVSPVDKVYKKILLNFRIMNVYIDPYNSSIISYSGEYYVEGFRDVNTSLIWMPTVCPKPITCQQGGHVNANTWEMLHKIAEMTGLGFAATRQCKEIPDRVVRHVHTQRFNDFIEQQLLHSGTDVNNIFDAWVDLYGYIVMVNVPWVLQQELLPEDLSIIANVGIRGTSNDLPEQKPMDVIRVITDYNLVGDKTNLEIEAYYMNIDNDALTAGTLERIYPISLVDEGRNSKIDLLDIQTKQNSIDGQYLEDYNTGKSQPIPKFDFNSSEWTGHEDGYNLNTQKRIRQAFFKKLNQSILNVRLKTINFGLQRGTLINVLIHDNDPANKDLMLKNSSRIISNEEYYEEDKVPLPPEVNFNDLIRDSDAYAVSLKLSGIYYIDGMTFEYTPETGKINQTLRLIKKGLTSGYINRHNGIGVPELTPKNPLTQTKLLVEQNKV